jgi:hypothetical protein
MTRWNSRRGALVALMALVLVAAVQGAEERAAGRMASAADRFLAALTPDLRQLAVFPFESDERRHWHFIPNEMFPRNGLPLRAMTEAQRGVARELLRTGLSDRGYATATGIMNDLESVLRDTERGGTMVRDPDQYRFSVFGTPSARGTWAWRVEGHHVSLNFTIVNGTFVAASPSFFGANPAEVRSAGRLQGTRVLALQEDRARALLASLDPAQRSAAVTSTEAPSDIKTMNAVDISPLDPGGLAVSSLSNEQKQLLMALLDAYTGVMTDDVAAARMARVRAAGLDRIVFAWMGDGERGKRHYYRLQGPTFLVEYDNTQNNANHIHSVWRDFEGDFGRDLLREHLKSVGH